MENKPFFSLFTRLSPFSFISIPSYHKITFFENKNVAVLQKCSEFHFCLKFTKFNYSIDFYFVVCYIVISKREMAICYFAQLNIHQRRAHVEKKPQILLLTHGGWGMSLLNGVRMILGAVDFVEEIPLMPEMTLPEYLTKVREKAETLPEGSLILTDVFGGTTTNVGAKLGKDLNIKVYSGLNAPMLLEACSQITFTEQLDMEAVLETGKSSVKDVVAEILKAMEEK